MVELIVGKKGKGKTKVLLDRVNGAVKEANGSIVYLDKSTKHMYELNNKVRLIDVSSYPLKNADEFVGFICGPLCCPAFKCPLWCAGCLCAWW